jgi:hypothetical protein
MRTGKKQFDGYFLVPDELGLCMVLEGPWSNSYRDQISKDRVTTLRLSKSAGWKAEDLGFLRQLRGLHGLEIYNWDVKDISAVNDLQSLRKLCLECNYQTPPNYSGLTRLKSCFIRWRPKSDDLFDCGTLQYLNVVNYPYHDLNPLQALNKLRVLKLTSSKLTALDGIESLQSLETLDLFRCKTLQTLEGIQSCANIRSLTIDTCSNVENLEPVGELHELRYLAINNCGNIRSLKPLMGFQKLEHLFFIENTNILDGDLSVVRSLSALRDTWFANRPHYSSSREEIKQVLRRSSVST